MDSYFGEIGHSFYGGPNGLSFSIKEVFPNRVALENDKNLDFTSSVQIGEYVIISYGNPNSDLAYYNQNKAIDAEAYNGQTFNATLWLKLVTANGGISYGEPIVTFTTSVPNFIFSSVNIAPGAYGNFYAVKIGEKSYSNSLCTEDEALVNLALEVENYNALDNSWEIKKETPSSPSRYVKNTSVFETKIVEQISSNEINKKYEIKISNPWDFQIGEVTPSNPGGLNPGPAVSITNTTDTKYLNFTLPNPWDISIDSNGINADLDPVLERIDSTNVTTRKWRLDLPNSWNVLLGGVTVLNPGILNPNPTVTLNNTTPLGAEDHNSKYIYFSLPAAWNFGLGDDSGDIDPIESASVTIDGKQGTSGPDSNTTKYFHIKIPNAWNILLGNDSGHVNPIENASVSIDRILEDEEDESNTTKYVHIKIPNAWNIALGNDSGDIDPIESASVDINRKEGSSGADSNTTKYVHIKIPNAWNIALGEDSGHVNPIEDASVDISRKISEDAENESNTTKYVHIKIPNAWNITLGEDSDTSLKIAVDPGVLPSVIIDRLTTAGQGTESNDTQYIHFKLPKAWNIALNTTTRLLPNENPEVEINTDSDTKYLHFKLPVSLEFTDDAFAVLMVGPNDDPDADTNFIGDDFYIHRYPKVTLKLPRAEKTIYGNAIATYNVNIGEDITVSSTGASRSDYAILSELEVKDFYINTTYAKVYKIKTKTPGAITATYFGSMLLAIPNIQGNVINPYDANGNPIVPNVVTNAVGPVSSWNVSVDVIKAPVFKKSADSGFVASTAQGVISSVAANDGVTYTIKIPKGTKITTQSEVPDRSTLVGTAMDGDLYFDNNGWIYRFDGITGNSWVRGASIHGNDFVIKNKEESLTINITASDLTPYSLEPTLILKMGAYILDTYPSYNNLKENEILNIIYSPELGVSIAYWLYKGANEWGGDLVTGTVSSAIIENTWQIDDEDNKAYSVTLINSLRTTITQLTNRVTALENAMAKAWGELPIIE